ncbi:FtsK/SpoIIIE domain-containing protein [Paenibacillus sp. sgz500992]|uniref:FtsK/SpoIIIE domain-containing protein n=1 Tax=Paenibacillus sp. sgz500992 TaxID=3242476 RepID=UPI0036D34231
MSLPEPQSKESFSQFVNRITLIAAAGSAGVRMLNLFPELNDLAGTILRYSIILWLSLVAVPTAVRLGWKHKLKMMAGLVIVRQIVREREWKWSLPSADLSQGKLEAGGAIGSIPEVPDGKRNGIINMTSPDICLSAERGPYALFPINPRPHSSSVLSPAQASELIFNTVQLAGMKMDEPPEILSIDAGPTLQTISFRLPARLQLSDLVKKRDDLANHIGHDRSFAVTSSPFSSAAAFILPHAERAFVYMRDMAQELMVFAQKAQLPMVFGKDMEGKPILVDLAKLPHLLVAGATGSGKSVFINGLLTSLASTRSPEQVQFLLIDPKMVEFTMYTGLPHLISPPVTDPKRAALTLKKLVVEMEKRYTLFAEAGVRNLLQYNRNYPKDQMPSIVAVIDEYADLMVIARDDVEDTVQRLTQMGRAAGIHLILGTQRPSVDVVTGVIKSNLPSRVAFHLLSVYDFKTVMDTGGPHLLGGGDGICMLNGGGQKRFQSAAISADDDETTRYIEELKRYWRNEESLRKENKKANEDFSSLSELPDEEENEPMEVESDLTGQTSISVFHSQEWMDLEEEGDPAIDESMYDQVIRLAREHNGVSGRLLQHELNIDYVTAATYVEQLSREGKVAPDYDPKTGLKPWLADVRESDEELLLRVQRMICETGSARSAELQQELGIRKVKVLKLMSQLVEVGFLSAPTSSKAGYTIAWSEEQIDDFMKHQTER